ALARRRVARPPLSGGPGELRPVLLHSPGREPRRRAAAARRRRRHPGPAARRSWCAIPLRPEAGGRFHDLLSLECADLLGDRRGRPCLRLPSRVGAAPRRAPGRSPTGRGRRPELFRAHRRRRLDRGGQELRAAPRRRSHTPAALDPHGARAEATGAHALVRALGPLNLVTLGIGAVIGAGIFVITGQVAALYAGPAVPLSMIVVGVACAFAGLCYAAMAIAVPVAGSAYTY